MHVLYYSSSQVGMDAGLFHPCFFDVFSDPYFTFKFYFYISCNQQLLLTALLGSINLFSWNLAPYNLKYATGSAKRGVPHVSNLSALTTHKFGLEKTIDLKFVQ